MIPGVLHAHLNRDRELLSPLDWETISHKLTALEKEDSLKVADMRVPVSETMWRGESTAHGVRDTLIHEPTSRILGMIGDFQPLDCYEAVDYRDAASKRHLGLYISRQAARDALMRAITKDDGR